MSANNGVIRIGRKGIVKFAFGDDGEPFEVDVVVMFNRWVAVDDSFRQKDEETDRRIIPLERVPEFHQALVNLVHDICGVEVTVAEAMDFGARLREQYDELADFFVPKFKDEPESSDTSEGGLVFSEEAPPS
jgi:hypothetical protein